MVVNFETKGEYFLGVDGVVRSDLVDIGLDILLTLLPDQVEVPFLLHRDGLNEELAVIKIDHLSTAISHYKNIMKVVNKMSK